MPNMINKNTLHNEDGNANEQPSQTKAKLAPHLNNSQLNSLIFRNQQSNQPQQDKAVNSPSIFQPLVKEKADTINQFAAIHQQMENLK